MAATGFEELNVYKMYELLFSLIEDQYGVEIKFTLEKKKKEGDENDNTKV